MNKTSRFYQKGHVGPDEGPMKKEDFLLLFLVFLLIGLAGSLTLWIASL